MKKGLFILSASALVLLAGFASAQSFSLGQALSSINPSNIILPIIFLALFLVLRISTGRVFKKNRGTGSVIAALLALAATYGTTRISTFQSWPSIIISATGISQDTFYTVGSIALIILVVASFIFLRAWTFIILGGLLLLASSSGLIYSSGIAVIAGIILLLAGIILLIKRKKKAKISSGNTEDAIKQGRGEISKERDMIARANALKNTEDDYIKENKRKGKVAAELEREKSEQKKSLMNSYSQVEQRYQNIISSNPQSPEIRKLYSEMVRIRDEIKRLGS